MDSEIGWVLFPLVVGIWAIFDWFRDRKTETVSFRGPLLLPLGIAAIILSIVLLVQALNGH